MRNRECFITHFGVVGRLCSKSRGFAGLFDALFFAVKKCAQLWGQAC